MFFSISPGLKSGPELPRLHYVQCLVYPLLQVACSNFVGSRDPCDYPRNASLPSKYRNTIVQPDHSKSSEELRHRLSGEARTDWMVCGRLSGANTLPLS